MNELIFGKDQTERIVGCEPGPNNTCELFIQDRDGTVSTKFVPLTHWILYPEKHSPKMRELAGDQPFKYLIEYDSSEKYNEVLKATRYKKLEHFICRDLKEAFMVKNGVTMYKGLKLKDVSVLSFDLEHTYGIGDNLNYNGKLLLISNTFRDPGGNTTKRLFSYDEFKSEAEMLNTWCNWVREVNPSMLIGHNIFGHDLKILNFAAYKHRVSLKLGRNGSSIRFDQRPSKFRKDGSQSYDYNNAFIYGRDIIDTFFLSIKHDVKRNCDNYKLKYLVNHFKVEKSNRTFYDASLISKNYLMPEEWEKIKAYCIDDGDDALSLFDLMSPAFFYTVQNIPRSFQQIINTASGSQINGIMVRAYIQNGHSVARASEKEEYRGALSFGVKGIHKSVFKIDVKSQYPSIILEWKIQNNEKDPLGYFLQLVQYFYAARIEYKRLAQETGDMFYKFLDDAAKIFLNSMYGFLGMGKANYNFPFGASEVTRHGREILEAAIVWATGKPFDPISVGLEIDCDGGEDECA